MNDVVRLSMWFVRTAAAALAGAVVRLTRRLRGVRPRIWFGPAALHSTRYNASAARHAGYPTRSVTSNDKPVKYALVSARDFDVVLNAGDVAWYDVHWLALIDLLRHADIWVTYFDGLFFRRDARRMNALALRLVCLVGIRIIAMPHGSDIVQLVRHRTRYDWIERFRSDYPSWDLVEQTGVSLLRLELFSRYARLVIASDPTLRRLMPRHELTFKYFPIDTDELRPGPFERREPATIVHAPNHRNTKGTDFLLAAMDTLHARGIACTLRLVERVPRDEALRMYAEADIIADQFCMGGPGVFALEGMALGKPTLTYLDQEHLGDPLFNFPLVNATPENLAEVLAALIAVPELRRRLGEAGRACVERYQSIPPLAEVWDRIFRHVWRDEPLRLEETVHFSPDRQPRAFTENPLDPAFWPVPIDDVFPQIQEAIGAMRGPP